MWKNMPFSLCIWQAFEYTGMSIFEGLALRASLKSRLGAAVDAACSGPAFAAVLCG
jgi:hypothetical protein